VYWMAATVRDGGTEADQNQGGVKYIIWGVIGIIGILIAAGQLGFTPTKITTPAVSVELAGGIAPNESNQKSPAPGQDTPQLKPEFEDWRH